jgi:hypothetical protein
MQAQFYGEMFWKAADWKTNAKVDGNVIWTEVPQCWIHCGAVTVGSILS